MKYLCFIFCVLLVGACSSTKGSGKDTLFCELDKEIQDTLQSVSQKVLEEDYAPQAMIDFSGNCKFTERKVLIMCNTAHRNLFRTRINSVETVGKTSAESRILPPL